MNDLSQPNRAVASMMESVLYEVKRVVVGQDHFLERILVAVLAQGHLLVEGVQGWPKPLPSKRWRKPCAASSSGFSSPPICCRPI